MLAVLTVAAIIALIPASIASKKGRSFFRWWLYGWMLWIVAFPHALSLKPLGEVTLAGPKKNNALKVALVSSFGFLALICVGIMIASSGAKKTEPAKTVATIPSKTIAIATNQQPAADEQPGVTKANFYRLRDGISYSRAVAILGDPGEEISRNSIGGTTTVMFQWKAESGFGNMNAMFQNGRLVSKAQFLLP